MNKLKIKKGDTVEIISGNDRGKQGVVERALPKKRKIVVSEVNIVKKHVKQRSQDKPGGIISMPKPIPVSRAMLVCPACKKKTRVGYEIKGNRKIRICKKCGGEIV